MLKTHMAACLLASALVAVPAFAQTATTSPTDRPAATGSGSTTSGSPAMQPSGTPSGTGTSGGAMSGSTAGGSGMSGGTAGGSGMSGGSMGSGTAGTTAPGSSTMGSSSGSSGSTMGSSSGSSGSGTASTAGSAASMKPLASPQPGQIMGSDLRGTRVYGANNESIGDISDLLLDKQGQVVAAIVGVGGFLGIGQKDVAVPFQALEIVPEGGASGSGSGTSSSPATTGSAGTAGSGTGTMNPDRVVLRNMTRADLESAPSFRSDGQASGSGGSSAPRQ
jgi:sporulation protein YlmC with PRC-barrel domain